ncbi:MAG: hypothetical protein HC786_00200 [Richelia sp. CSU_2_1]|nr:hypothetical protein [Microcoleus sp. SU_5_6]NJL68777.1 hypothetical protein [Microcoleus sp. SM1_3_4]NJR20716.1 hypothetical protein [Richelia sp. CSU_2_1]
MLKNFCSEKLKLYNCFEARSGVELRDQQRRTVFRLRFKWHPQNMTDRASIIDCELPTIALLTIAGYNRSQALLTIASADDRTINCFDHGY